MLPWVLGAATAGALVYAVLIALLYFAQNALIYPAPRGGARDPKDAGLTSAETWNVTSLDGTKLHGYLLFPLAAEKRARPSILVLHGNGENVSLDAAWLDLLRREGFVVAAIDYRGYGFSEGSPSEQGLIDDGLAALRALRARPEADPRRTFLLGSSLGSGVAVAIAAQEPVAGVILQSGFDSLRAVAKRHYPFIPAFLVKSPFDSLARIGRVACPVLFIHGDADGIIPITHARALAAKTPNGAGFFTVPGAGHNDLLSIAGPEYVRRIREFVGR